MAWPPSRVTRLPPSMTVFLLTGRSRVALTAMVTFPEPQLKVITPPFVAAACSAENVQLAGVPLPTTVVGVETSAARARAGRAVVQAPLGAPELPPPAEAPVPPTDPLVPAPPVDPP